MSRVLLILPSGTYRAPDFVAAAQAIGVDLVIGSDQALATDPAGERSVVLDLDRPEAAAEQIARYAEERPLQAIIAVDDAGVLTSTIAAERLELPHNPYYAAAATRDKIAMRQIFARTGLPQPAFGVLGVDEDPGRVAEQVGLPVVVKPTCLSGSRGVIRADDAEAAREAAERIRGIVAEAGQDKTAPLLVERFVPGREIAVEGLLRDGRFQTLAVFDKPDPLDGPYFEETVYVTPSRLDPAVLARVDGLCQQAVEALGLVEGPVHAEFRVDLARVVILELAARSIGGLCARALRFGLGVTLEELILRHALGMESEEPRREHAASGVMMLPIPRAGVLEAVDGLDAARGVPGITGLEITVTPGSRVAPLPEADRYLGFLFARGLAPEEVEKSLRAAHALLDIRIR